MSTTDEQRRSVGCLVCGRVLGSEPRPVSEPAAPFGDERFAHVRNKFGEKLTPLGQSIAAGMADFTARMQPSAVREPAAPVDARDAQLLKGLRSYLERDRKERFAAGDKRADAAQHFILDIDAALARQAAAPAEGA